MRLPLLFIIFMLSWWSAPSFGNPENTNNDAVAMSACIAKVGLGNAAKPLSEGGCVGLLRGPCLPDVPNTAETISCISREDAAWLRLTDNALTDFKSSKSAADFKKLTRFRESWINALPKVCIPDEDGSLAYIESEFCEQDELAKLTVYIMRRLTE